MLLVGICKKSTVMHFVTAFCTHFQYYSGICLWSKLSHLWQLFRKINILEFICLGGRKLWSRWKSQFFVTFAGKKILSVSISIERGKCQNFCEFSQILNFFILHEIKYLPTYFWNEIKLIMLVGEKWIKQQVLQ